MIKFVIVGTYRTGSSAFAESIGVNPDIVCGWEWTGAVPWWNSIRAARRALAGDFSRLNQRHQEHMAQVFKPDCAWLGFRALFSSSSKWIIHPRFSPALWIDRLEGHIHWLARATDIHIIHIIRRDALDWLKSVYLSKKSGLYVGKEYPEHISVEIPVGQAVARLRTKEWIDSRLSTLAQSNPYLQVNYEDFLLNGNSVTAAALEFLGFGPTIMSSDERRIFKQSKLRASDYISNYEQLLVELERSGLLRSRLP